MKRIILLPPFFSLAAGLALSPVIVSASPLSDFVTNLFTTKTSDAALRSATDSSSARSITSQNVALLRATDSPIPGGQSVPDVTLVDGTAIAAESGPAGTIVDVGNMQNYSPDAITVYTVRSGDTLEKISKMFGISVNTIIWANDLKSLKDIRPGDDLVILPISGVIHVVQAGDTIRSIAKKYGGDIDEIVRFNDISPSASLTVGEEVVVPNGEVSTNINRTVRSSTGITSLIPTYIDKTIDSLAYYIRPIIHGHKTQGLHGKNAVDIAPDCHCVGEEPILASAAGEVIVAKTGGWNGGYGNYVVINHPNSTQTVYGHMFSVKVSAGQSVDQGQIIGYVGSTGNSTGAHVHFEIRGATNPF